MTPTPLAGSATNARGAARRYSIPYAPAFRAAWVFAIPLAAARPQTPA